LGLLLGFATFQMPKIDVHARMIYFPRPTGWRYYHAKMNYLAITFGFVSIGEHAEFPHERIHRLQNQMMGPFFYPSYLLYVIKYGYWLNPYEVEARANEVASEQLLRARGWMP